MAIHDISRNSHKPADRLRDFGPIQPMEEAGLAFHIPLRAYMVVLAAVSIAFGCGWVSL